MYILSTDVLIAIKKNRPGIILHMALALNRTENTINTMIRENEINGDLTKAAVLDVFEEHLGMTREKALTKVNAAGKPVKISNAVLT